MVSEMLYSCILCVALLIDLFVLCVAGLTCLMKQFAICLGVNVIDIGRIYYRKFSIKRITHLYNIYNLPFSID